MPKQPAKAEVNTFVAGLITEASPLNYPPNASLDEQNFDLLPDGTRRRRLGFNMEPSGTFVETDRTVFNIFPGNYTNCYRWKDAGGKPDRNFIVMQSGSQLHVYRETTDGTPLSDNKIQELEIDGPYFFRKWDFAAVDGRLVITGGSKFISIVSVTTSFGLDVFTVTKDYIRVRDQWGIAIVGTANDVQFETDPSYRPTTIPVTQAYNLQNQSWGVSRSRSGDGLIVDPVGQYRTDLPFFPSNSEQVWAGMHFQPDDAGNPTERFYPTIARDAYGAASAGAKGYFIIDLIERGASRRAAQLANNAKFPELGTTGANAITTNPLDISEEGASIVASWAGRAFYAGFNGQTLSGDSRSPTLINYIAFSQLVKGSKSLCNCYQEGDPTSRSESDVVETDGGLLKIDGADRLIEMVPFGKSMIVFASNGVWAVTGGSDYGFSATNYRVDKISNFGTISRYSVVTEKGRIFFWSERGIFMVSPTQLGDNAVTPVSDGRIKKLYQSVPLSLKTQVVGGYDEIADKIRWFIPDDVNYGSVSELILDTQLSAFSRQRIVAPSGYKVAVLSVFDVTPYEITRDEVNKEFSSLKYAVALQNEPLKQKYCFGFYWDTSYKDLASYGGGTDAKGFLLTGAQIAGDSSIRKQIQFLTMHFIRTEKTTNSSSEPINPSSCLMRMQWDWSGKEQSNKWSALRQMYRDQHTPVASPSSSFDSGFDVISTRNMVRGQGRAFSMYIETEPGKDCQLLGWSVGADANPRT
jgi:hypothetical protein